MSRASYRVVVSGIGVISPYGAGFTRFWNGLLSVPTTSALVRDDKLDATVGRAAVETAEQQKRQSISRASVLGLLAAEEAMQSAAASPIESHTDTLVHVGTGICELEEVATTGALIAEGKSRRVSPYFVPKILASMPASHIAMKYKALGGVECSSTACATGVHALGGAFLAVRDGRARRAIAGATESCLNDIAVTGFRRMGALSKSGVSRPFDRRRDGFVMAEGSTIFLLERLEDATLRGVKPLAELIGYGVSSDCHHVSAPDPSGIGARLAMARALHDARLAPQQIGYVNAHATSTPTGDGVEALAIHQLFGDHRPFVSSIKGHIGHLLGAAGAIEAAATVAAVKHGQLPGNAGLEEVDGAEMHGLNLLSKATQWAGEERIGLCNSFGFGGTNASICIRNYDPSCSPSN